MSGSATILTRTFVHAPGVGHKTEKALWENGVTSWRKFLNSPTSLPKPLKSRAKVSRIIEQSLVALGDGNARFFADHLPREEWWRLYPNFGSRIAFLDIETTGLSHYYDEITLVGLYDGTKIKTFFAGHDLNKLPEYLAAFDVLVTFNGTLFDLPFLKTKFPSLPLPPIHLDLRFLLKRLGYSGGLKAIEKALFISRDKKAESVNGFLATVLWSQFRRGDAAALEKLIQYNIADVTNLHTLLHFVCDRMASGLLQGFHRNGSTPRLKSSRTISVRVKKVNGTGIDVVIDGTRTFLRNGSVERPLITLSGLLRKIRRQIAKPRVIGIDLRASEVRPTGWALLDGDEATTCLLRTDEEIIMKTVRHDPHIVSIDSPLGIPLGRCCTKDSCPCRAKGILRECERILWRRGVKVFPCLLPSMQKLTVRGMRLANEFRKRGFTVIESYPGAAQDIMRIPRKRSSLEELAQGLSTFGIKGPFTSVKCSHDELDAITSAVVGYFYLAGDYEALGDQREECLVVPKLNS